MQILLLFLLCFSIFANEEVSTVAFGPVVLGENRLAIDDKDIDIILRAESEGPKVKARLIKNTLQWVRVDQVLLVPRMKLSIIVSAAAEDTILKVGTKSILMQERKNLSHAHFFVDLFSENNIEIYHQGKKTHNVYVSIKKKSDQKNHLIDFSCSKYGIEVTGLDDIYLSMGCFLSRRGKFGSEKGALEVHWVASHLKLENKDEAPFVASFINNDPVHLSMIDDQGKKRKVTIKAKVPNRLHRLKLALGFGPYMLLSKQNNIGKESKITSPIMLYSNFYLTPTTSIRSFEAIFYNGSLFNNFGMYFAYDLGFALDGRLGVFPLLGFQGVTHKHKDGDSLFKMIYPQGFEVFYKHAFGYKNHSLVYGMFFSPKSNEDYKNYWLRYGKKVFWEVNYLSWKDDSRFAESWGLSVGIPIGGFF